MLDNRIIGVHDTGIQGPLLICFGGMHGNEPAGIKALEKMFEMLVEEPVSNPHFQFKGRLVGLRGNLRAIAQNKRFIKKDLNRQWTDQNIERVRTSPIELLDEEDLELRELSQTIEKEVASYKTNKIVILDLHTTTAFGGIFSIPTRDPESVRIAVELHAPVIEGLLDGIHGTTLHYFSNERYTADTVAVCFESGQHNEELSVNRAIAALTNCMRTLNMVKAEDVENRHDALLIEHSTGLPQIAELITTHPIQPGDNFRMAPNYKNFQKVKKGDIIAYDINGEIKAPEDALILMPLYQKQGDDGFFLIKTLIAF